MSLRFQGSCGASDRRKAGTDTARLAQFRGEERGAQPDWEGKSEVRLGVKTVTEPQGGLESRTS